MCVYASVCVGGKKRVRVSLCVCECVCVCVCVQSPIGIRHASASYMVSHMYISSSVSFWGYTCCTTQE